ncbi:MAG: TRAP transporter TatT component family protein [Roseimicrobium sp.]
MHPLYRLSLKAPHSLLAVLAISCASCTSLKKAAINSAADAMSGAGTAFSSDDDPEFVKAAIPFSLKTMESLLEQSPKHKGLLLALTSYFTQYGYAFMVQEADELEGKDLDAANALRDRATRMFRRSWGYGIRGLEVSHPGFEKELRANPKATVQKLTKADVPLLYWTAAAAGLRIRADRPETVADQPIVEAMIDRALELDESFEKGSIHAFLIKYEMNRQGVKGDATVRSRKHFNRAVELSQGLDAGPYVTLAEAVCVPRQDAKEFESLLNKALAIDPDAYPPNRLVNSVMQRRARWLLARKDDLILPPLEPLEPESPTDGASDKPATPLLPKP